MKKSTYLFLSALLGVFLFFILHRVIIFIFMYMLSVGYLSTSMTYEQFLLVDYSSLFIVLALGLWYGIWLGTYWFDQVYTQRSHAGFVDHLSQNFFISKPKTLGSQMAVVKQRLETDLSALEKLTDTTMVAAAVAQAKVTPIKRKVVRKRAPAKLKVNKS